MHDLHVGTSGWSYQHWAGRFYPKEVKSREYLEYYVTHFDCVELNACFYRLPKEAVVKGWMKRTPDEFLFCLKMSRWITHIKRLHEAGDSLKMFFDRFRPLKKKLGPLLVQLPPSLIFNEDKVRPFFKLLHGRYRNYRFALEARHPSWVDDKVFTTLSQYGIAWVIADSGGFYPSEVVVTTDFVYLRFHGPGGLYASNYPEELLQPYAESSKTWLQQGKSVWAFFNNDANAHAVENARAFRAMIMDKAI